MDIAVVKETTREERRVALVPAGVDWLVRLGHRIYVEAGAGEGAGFADNEYEAVGAKVVFGHDEACRRAGLVVRVASPSLEECGAFQSGQMLVSFLEIGLQSRDRLEALRAAGVNAFASELFTEDDETRPVYQAMGEITAGRIPVLAGRYMNSLTGGRGIILGDVPGVPPASVVVIGAGTVGGGAARKLGALGAKVTLLDTDLRRLRAHLTTDPSHPATLLSTPFNLESAFRGADIVVCAASAPGNLAPRMVTRDLVKVLRPRSLIIDVSIDHGGCAETSRPTRHSSPTYIEEGVIHYCVPNIPSSVARSSSYALTNATLPYVTRIAGDRMAARSSMPVARALYLSSGFCTNEKLASLFGLAYERMS
jgi:alanine dehydrogenase